jgi:DNA-binding transcriptional ArsR family regulator
MRAWQADDEGDAPRPWSPRDRVAGVTGTCRDVSDRITYNLMVVYLPHRDRADLVFHALADPTRRDIVEAVMRSESSVSALGRRYPMSLTAVQKHVAVLERAGLVRKRRRGREQLVTAEIQAVRDAARLLDRLETIWRDRLERFADVLAEPTGGPVP